MKYNKIILGSIVALVSFAIVVYAIETNKSLIQLFIGFIIFLLPIIFISSFRTTAPVFILVLLLAFFGYGMYKFNYYDTLLGALLAIIIGGSIAYFRVGKYKLFSTKEYKEKINENKEDK